MGITLFFVCLGKCTMNYFGNADMVTAPPIPLSLDCPPCVRQEGHKPLAEYTRRILSNMCVKGGVCIMPTTIVRVLSVIGGLTFLSFLSFLVIITPRTQHTLFFVCVHLDIVWATPA